MEVNPRLRDTSRAVALTSAAVLRVRKTIVEAFVVVLKLRQRLLEEKEARKFGRIEKFFCSRI